MDYNRGCGYFLNVFLIQMKMSIINELKIFLNVTS